MFETSKEPHEAPRAHQAASSLLNAALARTCGAGACGRQFSLAFHSGEASFGRSLVPKDENGKLAYSGLQDDDCNFS